MPTPANAFDFEDNPSGSDDELPRIPRRVNTPSTVHSIHEDTMTGNLAAQNARCARGNARSKSNTKRPKTTNAQAPDPEEERTKLKDLQKQEQEARLHQRDLTSAINQKADDFATSFSDEVLSKRLWLPNPGGQAHGRWDGNVIRQEVARDGNCFIHVALRCSDYDPHEKPDGPVYEAKVLKLRKYVCEYLVDHADTEDWTRNCDKRIQRGRKVVHVANYSEHAPIRSRR